MNERQMRGQWTQLRGKLQRAWGALTGRPSREVGGMVNQASGVVQEKFGDAQEADARRRTRNPGTI